MGANVKITSPVDETLKAAGLPADSKAVGDRFDGYIKKETIDGWTCLTLACGVKVAYYQGDYGTVNITSAEGALYWAEFSKALPTEFFSAFPCVNIQCELRTGYGLYCTTNPQRTLQKISGWFYANSKVQNANPYIYIICIGG